ncbi:hypothetical protein ACTPEO_03110 [Clostridioides difficile]
MSISINTRSTRVNQSNYNNESSDKLESFDKQIQKLESLIADLRTDKNMDSKIKNMKIEVLQEQINDLKKQKQEYAGQLTKGEILKKESKQDYIKQESTQDKYNYAKGLTYCTTEILVSSDCDMKNISKTNRMRISLSDDIRAKNMEMGDSSPTESDLLESSNLSNGLSRVNASFGEQISASIDKIKEDNKKLEEVKEKENSKEEKVFKDKQEYIDGVIEENIVTSSDLDDKYKESISNNSIEKKINSENQIYTESGIAEELIELNKRINTVI